MQLKKSIINSKVGILKSFISISIFVLFGFLFFLMWFSHEPMNAPTSTVVYDADGNLIGARIAADEQWRFPAIKDVPEKFKTCIIQFEDRHFYFHFGVNPFALIRATWQNLMSSEIVSGGSTLSMQVIRLSRNKRKRNIKEKVIEMLLAIRMEFHYSKNEILCCYTSNTPFGGNIVGLDAAAWRYYGRNPEDLSWAETATLAVLPNAPGLITPGKNREFLLHKRNKLLKNLLHENMIDSVTYTLSIAEPLVQQPLPLPQDCYHLVNRVAKSFQGEKIITSVQKDLQTQVNNIVHEHAKKLSVNKVRNAAAIVVEVNSGAVLAYVGNTHFLYSGEHGTSVDMITSARSSGSILKPLLFSNMIEGGEILSTSLVADIPVQFGGHTPHNFSHSYDGAVSASKSLSRSLNIPAIKLLQKHGYPRFYHELKNLGITTLNQDAGHYGLSLILGGSEVTLWDLTGIYASMSRVLNHYQLHHGKYNSNDFHPPYYNISGDLAYNAVVWTESPPLDAASIWLTYEALLDVNRPEIYSSWTSFSSSQKIAWKTGTSFGFRDAWAIGTTPDFVVGVWVGNADGEGRAGLTGTSAAAPIMFDIFNLLPAGDWFLPPYDELEWQKICSKSGYKASSVCPHTDSILAHFRSNNTPLCPYHHLINLSYDGQYQLSSDCASIEDIYPTPWFILPPAMAYYYRQNHPEYINPPPFDPDCFNISGHSSMEFIYPRGSEDFYIPTDLEGKKQEIIFEIAHITPGTSIFWHLDAVFLGKTIDLHQMPVNIGEGVHLLLAMDENGNTLKKKITVLIEK